MFVHQKISDNYITPIKNWRLIYHLLDKEKVYYDPFFCDGSIGEELKKDGFKIIHQNQDFFNCELPEFDIILTNPPFSIKEKVFDKFIEINKPFIVIAPSTMLSLKYFQKHFRNKIQLIIPPKRLTFLHLDLKKRNKNYTPPYASFFFCYKMELKKDILWIE